MFQKTMNIRSLIVLLFLGILVFVIGVTLGVLYQSKKGAAPTQSLQQTMPDSTKILSSKIVSSITVVGEVTKTDNNNITLMYQSDSRIIKMAGNVSIYALVDAPAAQLKLNGSKYITRQGNLQDIKVGENLEVNVRVLPNGQVEAFNVIIMPIPTVVPTPVVNTIPAPAVKK